MALLICPECKGQVSDRALNCPHCGFPISELRTDRAWNILCFDDVKIDISEALYAIKRKDNLAELEIVEIEMDNGIEEKDDKRFQAAVYEHYKSVENVIPIHAGTKSTNTPHCPTCGSTDIETLGAGTRAAAGVMFGLFSKTARSQFRCKNCGYKW